MRGERESDAKWSGGGGIKMPKNAKTMRQHIEKKNRKKFARAHIHQTKTRQSNIFTRCIPAHWMHSAYGHAHPTTKKSYYFCRHEIYIHFSFLLLLLPCYWFLFISLVSYFSAEYWTRIKAHWIEIYFGLWRACERPHYKVHAQKTRNSTITSTRTQSYFPKIPVRVRVIIKIVMDTDTMSRRKSLSMRLLLHMAITGMF